MEYDKNKHLEFIQNVVTRMNSNSFQIKAWTISIVTGLFAIYAATNNPLFISICLLPVLLFWILDSYYLVQERKFRGLYDDVAMDIKSETNPYSMNIGNYKKGKYRFLSVCVSVSTILLYLPLIIVIIWTFICVTKTCC